MPKPTIFTFAGSYQNPRVQQASVGMDWEVMTGTSLAVTYMHVAGDQLPRSTDLNFGPSSPAVYTVAGTGEQRPYYRFAAGPYTNFARIISFQSTAVRVTGEDTFEIEGQLSQGSKAPS